MTPPEIRDAVCITCGSALEPHIPAISDDRYGCLGVYTIARCPVCGQMATLPPLQEADLPALYSQYYPRREVDYDGLEREAGKAVAPFAKLKRWLAGTDNQGHYRARPGQRVLDIGSGSCLSLLELRAMGVEAWGVEADTNVRAIASHFGLEVHIGSIHDTPFPDLSFDLIVLNQVIEHVPDPLALLAVVQKRLNPGGRVMLSFPNTESFQIARSGIRWINWHVPYHQHHFSLPSFTRLAARAGYDVVHARSITPNLWSLLQLRANREKPVEGKTSPTWNGQESIAGTRREFTARLKGALQSRAARVLAAAMGVMNRVWDVAGRGDSLLVELHVAGRERG